MKALVYRRSVPLYLLERALSRLQPRKFFPGLAPLALRDMPFLLPRPGWVTLRNRLCGICGSDLGLLRATESFLLEPYCSFPAVLGHELAAEVVSAPVGSEWKPGDRVVVEPILACNVRGLVPCRFCAQGAYNLCENFTDGTLAPGSFIGYNRSAGGGMAEFTTAHPDQLFRIPCGVSDEVAVLTDSVASALHPVLGHFPEDGETVVIYGAGIIGQHIIRTLRALGSRAKLVAVVRYPFQGELARTGGADVVLASPSRRDLAESIGARILPTTLGGGNLEGGADVFFDCVANGRSLQEGLLALRGKGAYVMVGTASRLGSVDFSSLWFRELRMTGSSAYAYADFRGRRIRTYAMAVELLARGDYPLHGLLSHTFRLHEYGRAFRTAFDKRHHQSVKVAFDMR
jgi:erythritol/L-threitol dehydrogenase